MTKNELTIENINIAIKHIKTAINLINTVNDGRFNKIDYDLNTVLSDFECIKWIDPVIDLSKFQNDLKELTKEELISIHQLVHNQIRNEFD